MKTLRKVALFWDVDRSQLDVEENADFIIKRILERGDADDVRWMFTQYERPRIAGVARRARGLDRRSSNFWAHHFEDEYASGNA